MFLLKNTIVLFLEAQAGIGNKKRERWAPVLVMQGFGDQR